MGPVWMKIRADVLSRPLVSLLVMVTILSAATLLTLALATLLNLSEPYNRAFEYLNGAHLWLYFDRRKLRVRDVERIEALPEVVESTGVQYSVGTRVRIHDTRVWVSVRMMPLQPPRVNRLLVQEGRYLLPHQQEVLASRDLRDLYGLEVGESVKFRRQDGGEVTLPVIGLAYNPTWDTYRNTQPPYVYVSEATMRYLYPDEEMWEWSLGLRLADPEAVDEVLVRIEGMLNDGAVVGHTDWRDVRRSANFGARLNFILLGAFSFFAILATVLVIVSSISSFVLSQYRQIGILKAVGFTRQQILLLYIGQYVTLSLVGVPLGLGLGLLLSPLPLRNVASSLSTTFRPPLTSGVIVLVMVTVPGIVVLTTLKSAWRAAQANIVRAIATGAEAPARRSSWGARAALALGLPVPFVLGVGDLSTKPMRSLMTGLNLALGVVGVVFGLLLNETLEMYKAHPTLLGIPYDATVTRQMSSNGYARHLLAQAPGVQAFYGETLVEAETLDGRTFQLRAVDGNVEAFPFNILEGRMLRRGTYEAIAGQGLLDWLGLRVGDAITLIVNEQFQRPLTWRIVGRYTEPVNTGQMMIVDWSTVARHIHRARPFIYRVKLVPGADVEAFRAFLEPRPDADLSVTLVGQAIPGVVVYLQIALFVLAGILIGIALVNVFNTSLLAVQERLRAIGILKTLGLTPRQVMCMVSTTAGVLGFFATLVGIPVGWSFTRMLLAMLARTYGFGEVRMALNGWYLAILPFVMVGVSVLGSLLPARRAARLPIVNVMRSE